MEQKMVRVPFHYEMAKRITEGVVKGKIVTRNNLPARIVCWDRKDSNYPLIVLVSNGGKEECLSYTSRGTYNGHSDEHYKDIFLEVPEYMTFEDGDVIVQSWKKEDGRFCREDFIAGWDAAVDYLANLPLDKMLKYFESVLNDKPFESIIEDVKRLKDR